MWCLGFKTSKERHATKLRQEVRVVTVLSRDHDMSACFRRLPTALVLLPGPATTLPDAATRSSASTYMYTLKDISIQLEGGSTQVHVLVSELGILAGSSFASRASTTCPIDH